MGVAEQGAVLLWGPLGILAWVLFFESLQRMGGSPVWLTGWVHWLGSTSDTGLFQVFRSEESTPGEFLCCGSV